MTISPAYPDLLQNGNPADATQVMADFYQIQNDVNANAAANGANSDITSLTGLTTPIPALSGGTGVAQAATITLGGNLTFSGAFAAIITLTGNTTVTLPVTGTLIGSDDTNTVTNSMLAQMAGNTVKINNTNATANAVDLTVPPSGIVSRLSTGFLTTNTLSAILDDAIGNTRGSLAYRGASVWQKITPGTAMQVLTTFGGGADPAWAIPLMAATTVGSITTAVHAGAVAPGATVAAATLTGYTSDGASPTGDIYAGTWLALTGNPGSRVTLWQRVA